MVGDESTRRTLNFWKLQFPNSSVLFGCFILSILICSIVFFLYRRSREITQHNNLCVQQLAISPDGNVIAIHCGGIAADCGGHESFVAFDRRSGKTTRYSMPSELTVVTDMHTTTFVFENDQSLISLQYPSFLSSNQTQVVEWDISTNTMNVRATFDKADIELGPISVEKVIARTIDSDGGEVTHLHSLKCSIDAKQPVGCNLKTESHSGLIQVSEDGRFAVYKRNQGTEVVNIKSGSIIFQKPKRFFIDISVDGSYICLRPISWSEIEIWDINEDQRVFCSARPLGYVQLLPDGKRFISNGFTLSIWNFVKGTQVAELTKREYFYPKEIVSSRNGGFVAATDGEKVKVWDMRNFAEVDIEISR